MGDSAGRLLSGQESIYKELRMENNQVIKNQVQELNMQVFNCELGSVRVIVENGEPLFMAYDLCISLEYKNGKDTINRLFKDGVAKYYPIKDRLGREQKARFLTESQMYKLIMRSNAKNAETFQDWICNEVLPSIRKNGGYIVGQEKMTDLEVIANALVVANNVIQQKSKELEMIKALREAERPKVEFADKVTNANNAISVGAFAKLLADKNVKIGQNRLFEWLRVNRYLDVNNLPYQKYIELDYFKVIE